MKRSLIQSTLLALSSVLVFGCATAEKASPKMAEVTVNAKLTSDYGRSLVSSPRGNYMIVDSVPPLKGPNQELNPADMLLSSLATCALFVYEAEAAAAGKPMTSAMVTVQGDFNPKGILSDKINPKFQAFRIGVQAEGYTEEDLKAYEQGLRKRCPIFTTLVRTASIEVLNNKPIGKSKLKIKTPSVSAELLSGGGRAMVKARKNIFVVDSVPPLKGPNETMNPLDVLLAAQATCVLFVAEYVYKKEKASSDGLQAKVTATFNPKGVKDGSVNPRITSMKIDLSGGDEKAQTKAQEFLKGSCPIYTTLSDSFEIELM